MSEQHPLAPTVPGLCREPASCWLRVTSFSLDFPWRRNSEVLTSTKKASECVQRGAEQPTEPVPWFIVSGCFWRVVSGVCGLTEVQKLIHTLHRYSVYKMGGAPWAGCVPLVLGGRPPSVGPHSPWRWGSPTGWFNSCPAFEDRRKGVNQKMAITLESEQDKAEMSLNMPFSFSKRPCLSLVPAQEPWI